jgi:HAD superfamily hydrolase (TIGR01459 family)
MMSLPKIIDGLREISSQYDVVLCDIWGVIHNGHSVFPGVAEALSRFRKGSGIVILVSNAPRPAATVVPQLDGLGLDRTAWDAIVTSGDVTRSAIINAGNRSIWHLGPERDRPLFSGMNIREVTDKAAAEVVVCTGLFDDTIETAETYRPMLEQFLSRNVPLICANPDIVVERAGKLVYCAGAIADLYTRMGGEAISCGKPHQPIYDAAFDIAESLLGQKVSPSRVLAIGDSVRTDLSGASSIGCGALFVAAGIHGEEVCGIEGNLDPVRLATFFEGQSVRATAAIGTLVW